MTASDDQVPYRDRGARLHRIYCLREGQRSEAEGTVHEAVSCWPGRGLVNQGFHVSGSVQPVGAVNIGHELDSLGFINHQRT